MAQQQFEPVPLNFIPSKETEWIVSYLFRMNNKIDKSETDLPTEVCQLTSSFIGSLDSRVPFWNKYEKNMEHETKLVFYFEKAWDWMDNLSLNIDGTYTYKWSICRDL